jgi:hypothetical protein
LFEIRAGVWVETGQLPGPADCVDAAVAIDGPFAVIGNYVYAVGDRFSLADFAAFENCFTPVTEPIRPECERFDLERDERVDARDLSLLLLSFRGP